MLDIKFIRENADKVKEAARNKNRKVDIDRLLEIDEVRRKLIGESENLRAERNKLAKEAQKDPAARGKGRALKEKIAKKNKKITTFFISSSLAQNCMGLLPGD